MARLIDVLKKREPATDSVMPPQSLEVGCVNAVEDVGNASFSFIEIDGATRTLLGSPDVLTVAIKPPEMNHATPPPTELEGKEKASIAKAFVFQPCLDGNDGGALDIPSDIVVVHEPDSPRSRAYIELTEQLLGGERPPQALAFTAPTAEVDLATPLLNIAAAVARRRQRQTIMLFSVETAQTMAERLGLCDGPSLEQVARGKVALDQAIQSTAISRLSIMPIGDCDRGPLSSVYTVMRWALGVLRARFDLVLMELGAWRATPAQALLASLCDGICPFVPQAESSGAEKRRFLQRLATQANQLRGVIQVQG